MASKCLRCEKIHGANPPPPDFISGFLKGDPLSPWPVGGFLISGSLYPNNAEFIKFKGWLFWHSVWLWIFLKYILRTIILGKSTKLYVSHVNLYRLKSEVKKNRTTQTNLIKTAWNCFFELTALPDFFLIQKKSCLQIPIQKSTAEFKNFSNGKEKSFFIHCKSIKLLTIVSLVSDRSRFNILFFIHVHVCWFSIQIQIEIGNYDGGWGNSVQPRWKIIILPWWGHVLHTL